MAQAGFSVRYPYFQRERDGCLELVNLVNDKWGGGFFLEFAKCDTGDLQTAWGEIVPEAEIEVAHTDPATRARLLATTRSSGSRNDYFRFESFADDRAKCDDLVKELIDLLPQVLAWLEDGTIGPNISPYSNS